MAKLKIYILFSLFAITTTLHAQLQRASLRPDGTIQVENLSNTIDIVESRGGTFEQLPGFPKGMPANPSFKNFRNVTLADITGDGVQEIVVGIYNTLYAFSNDSLLWQKPIEGTAIFPPSVADMDGDGDAEIALLTGGAPFNGRTYLLDHEGNDLPGWPLNFDNNWMANAPVLADLNGDAIMELIACEIDGSAGNVHILNLDATPFGENWPQTLAGRPAVTPSVGDVDGDEQPEIVAFSTQAQYVFELDGTVKDGWPIDDAATRFSYQSPVLRDLDDSGTLQIIGATHGDAPEYYIRNFDGSYYSNWPLAVPENNWTFSPPTVIEQDGEYTILMSRPIGESPTDMLYGWDKNGNLREGFPIIKSGGLEGPIIVADLDGDEEVELLFGSNLFDSNLEQGFLHAYEMDGSGELDGFPIRPRGWTFINGATPGDVNNDGLLDITMLTYTQNFGAKPDSAFINVYNLNVKYNPETILWGTYKGSNQRTGALPEEAVTQVSTVKKAIDLQLFPNPARTEATLSLKLSQPTIVEVDVTDINGRLVHSWQPPILQGEAQFPLSLKGWQSGTYFITVKNDQQVLGIQKLIVH